MSGFALLGLVAVVIIFLIIQMYANDDKSKDRTKLEKYGKATGKVAKSFAESIAGAASTLTESKEHKKKRIATEHVAFFISRYKRKKFDWQEPNNPEADYLNNSSLRDSLAELGIDKEQWVKTGEGLIQLSNILFYNTIGSKDEATPPFINENNWKRDKELREALRYFKVPKEDWIKYGTKILSMYDIYHDLGIVDE